ncbi:hypothetical protein A3F45_00985 [Candidatus Curtissbacteria bacterium RIFCSPHIGHO2_12_FULL_41_17]|uniref:Uncharacterized protein n=2 Tax=Candidatus Curtissiibacteriota TaxID=1752717 RepID=A0A1F5HJ80_9BACT|nr:MAG: hypothetical protein A2693_02155 [Candidatus Curtissbacteria bacterium RIFCSPHIGHO2_01_FULL_40_12]OGE04119.1 MAG: hypothetical protein A3F45_00985 [Candidatus Curtissbacteria bacterium RIFCSPHIGHO2_12_FULL_41_17]
MKHFEKIAHSFLVLGFLVGLLAIFKVRYDTSGQFWVILALALFYLIWGFIYHSVKGDLARKLILEYLLIALICAVAAFGVFAS